MTSKKKAASADATQTVLVTGATGFLGSWVVQELLGADYDVVALCRDVRAPRALGLPDAVTRRRGDVLDPSSVMEAAAGCETVVHCAGMVSRRPEDAGEMHRVHLIGTNNVLDACREAGLRRAVVASTSGTVAIRAEAGPPCNEQDETPLALINRWPYYRSKYYAEQAALKRNGENFDVICVNPTLLLGPGDEHGGSTEHVRMFLERRIPAVLAGGLSFVDVRDAAHGMVLALAHGRPGERYLLSACNMEVRDFFGRLERISGIAAPWLPMPDSPRARGFGVWALEQAADLIGTETLVDPVSVDMAQHYWYVDASRAQDELGFTPRDPMVTLVDTVEDLRTQGRVSEPIFGAETFRLPSSDRLTRVGRRLFDSLRG